MLESYGISSRGIVSIMLLKVVNRSILQTGFMEYVFLWVFLSGGEYLKSLWHTIYHKLVPKKSYLVSAVVAIVATWSEYVFLYYVDCFHKWSDGPLQWIVGWHVVLSFHKGRSQCILCLEWADHYFCLPAKFKSNSSHPSLSDCCTTLMVASFGCTLFIFGFEFTASLTLPFAPSPDSCLAEQTCFMPISITYLCSELLAGEQYGDHSGISPVSHVDCRGSIWILFEKEPIT